MKTRTSYVSNSSSSSFVVIPDEVKDDIANEKFIDVKALTNVFTVGLCSKESYDNGKKWNGFLNGGETQFGWQTRKYNDLESKWNWLVLQACYGGDESSCFCNNEYRNLIDDYLHEFDSDFEIDWKEVEELEKSIEAYIDHQSIDAKSTFEDVSTIGISQFLINTRCYVQNGNDNE